MFSIQSIDFILDHHSDELLKCAAPVCFGGLQVGTRLTLLKLGHNFRDVLFRIAIGPSQEHVKQRVLPLHRR